MFYSHFILAKKGPLGTVWIAAHLERKLRKNQVTETNICASVDSIMFPEVPIALRLSGHLLLGVVRIYSRKVNYLYQDCSVALEKIKQAFKSVQVDLPAGATNAPFHSITLPETFEFEDLEEEFLFQAPDTHLTTREQITLNDNWRQEQISGTEPYTMIYLDEEARRHSNSQHASRDNIIPPIEEDMLPPFPMDDNGNIDQIDMDIDQEISPRPMDGPESDSIPEHETLRSAIEVPLHRPSMDGLNEAEKSSDATNEAEAPREDDIERPILEEIPVLREQNSVFGSTRTSTGPRLSTGISGDEDLLTTALGGLSQGLTVMPTPPKHPPENKRKRSRKRKIVVDEFIVLSNESMKKQLQHTQDIRRTRKRVPFTSLTIWKAHRRCNMQKVFSESSIPGLSSELQESFRNVFTAQSLKVSFRDPPDQHFVGAHEDKSKFFEVPEMEPAEFEPTFSEVPEIETARFATTVDDSISPGGSENLQRMEDTTVEANEDANTGMEIPGILEQDPVTELGNLRTRKPADFDFQMPSRQSIEEGEQMSFGTPVVGVSLYDDQDDQFPRDVEDNARNAGSAAPSEQGHGELDRSGSAKQRKHDRDYGWSARTRRIAQYLQSRFKNPDKQEESLQEILAGRPRKDAAKLFFEILVLKSKDFIQVDQKESYGDILLLPTSKLLTLKI